MGESGSCDGKNLVGVVRLNDFSLILSRSEKLTNARKRLNELFGKNIQNVLLRRM